MTTPITISKTKPFTGKTLKEGQQVNIIVGKKTFEYSVTSNSSLGHLRCHNACNDEIFTYLPQFNGRNTDEACSIFKTCVVGGINGDHGDWPCGTLTAQVKLLRALFKKPTAAELKAERIQAEKEAAKVVAEKRARDRKLKGLTLQARGLAHYFDANKDAFGCQRKHVLAICDILTGYSVSELVKS